MSRVKIYGSPQSSAGRVYWMLEEAGVQYDRVALNMREKEHKSPAYLAINPNGKVPTLVDGEFIIWESMAINQYLAEKYLPRMLGRTSEEKGLILQWSYWSILEMQKPAVDWLIQAVFVPEERRDHSLIEKCQKALPPLMTILDKALANKKYLATDDFSLADLNVASVVNVALSLGFSIDAYANLKIWLAVCKDRPSYKKVAELGH